jgi:hypothetical protein
MNKPHIEDAARRSQSVRSETGNALGGGTEAATVGSDRAIAPGGPGGDVAAGVSGTGPNPLTGAQTAARDPGAEGDLATLRRPTAPNESK